MRWYSLLILPILLVACGAPQASSEEVSIAMGYIPDVQFAPFYVADAKGYYADEGLKVKIDHSDIRDALVQVAQGRLTFANAAGDEVLTARSQDVPIEMVFQTYQALPVAVFAKQSTGIATPEDLRGKTIGIPGRFGATYIGLRGLMYAAGMQESDVNIQEVGFTQAAAVREDKVDAAVGYANNEPFVLQDDGVPVNTIHVSDWITLVSNGIVTSDDFAAKNPDTVKRFARATARGLQDTLDDPDAAFELALKYIPELPEERRPAELRKLKETLALWSSPGSEANGLGYSDPATWAATHQFLRESGILQSDVDVEQAFTNDLRQ